MTIKQRILALDAAAVACEGIAQDPKYRKLQDLINSLQNELEKIFDVEYENVPFGDYLEEQAKAVEALTKCPVVWGGVEA